MGDQGLRPKSQRLVLLWREEPMELDIAFSTLGKDFGDGVDWIHCMRRGL